MILQRDKKKKKQTNIKKKLEYNNNNNNSGEYKERGKCTEMSEVLFFLYSHKLLRCLIHFHEIFFLSCSCCEFLVFAVLSLWVKCHFTSNIHEVILCWECPFYLVFLILSLASQPWLYYHIDKTKIPKFMMQIS